MRRLSLILMLLLAAGAAGCQTAEVAVNYPVAGVYIVAKFAAKEPKQWEAPNVEIARDGADSSWFAVADARAAKR